MFLENSEAGCVIILCVRDNAMPKMWRQGKRERKELEPWQPQARSDSVHQPKRKDIVPVQQKERLKGVEKNTKTFDELSWSQSDVWCFEII